MMEDYSQSSAETDAGERTCLISQKWTVITGMIRYVVGCNLVCSYVHWRETFSDLSNGQGIQPQLVVVLWVMVLMRDADRCDWNPELWATRISTMFRVVTLMEPMREQHLRPRGTVDETPTGDLGPQRM